ncbi:hypothetical protein ACFLQV_01290 [Calditrichota bacterium]
MATKKNKKKDDFIDIRDMIVETEVPSTEVEERTKTVGRIMQLRDALYDRAMAGNMQAADEYRKLEAWLLDIHEVGKLVDAPVAYVKPMVAGVKAHGRNRRFS